MPGIVHQLTAPEGSVQGAGSAGSALGGSGWDASAVDSTDSAGSTAGGAAGSTAGGADEAAISLKGVDVSYTDRSGRTVRALMGLSLRGEEGEVLAVVGPSGCGKTTLLEVICGLRDADRGEVRTAPAALMPQRDLLLPWLSALDNAALPLRIAGAKRARARARAAPLFAEMGLAGFERARPAQLSGGMRQRVAFVRTLLSGKHLLCLDEPFGALDAITRMQMQGWLAEALAKEPRTIVLVTHDVEEAVLLADRVAVLSPRPGQVVAEMELAHPRPRARTDRAVIEMREKVLDALGLPAERGEGG